MTKKLERLTTDAALHRKEIIDDLIKYSLTDMLFFWSTEKGLMERQFAEWQPLLDWAENEFETKYEKTESLDVPQSNHATGWRLKSFLDELSDKELAAFFVAAQNMRSVLLAAALIKKHITADQAFKAAFLEELYQAENWGSDDETEKRRGQLKQELMEIEAFLK